VPIDDNASPASTVHATRGNFGTSPLAILMRPSPFVAPLARHQSLSTRQRARPTRTATTARSRLTANGRQTASAEHDRG
jgi:hypothetical protein